MSDETAYQAPLPLSPLQLRDVFPVMLCARRFKVPSDVKGPLEPAVNLAESVTFVDDERCEVELRANVRFEGEIRPFEVEAAVVGFFVFDAAAGGKDEFTRYIQSAARAILLPFLREAIHELSVRLHIPPLLLPLVVTPEQKEPPTEPAAEIPYPESSEGRRARPPGRSRPTRSTASSEDEPQR